jgi:hypothetical protein
MLYVTLKPDAAHLRATAAFPGGGTPLCVICAKARSCRSIAADPKHVSTSYVERQNLTMRMQMRRFMRPTNGFSKKVDDHWHMVALHYMDYNFCRVPRTLRCTRAIEAEIANHVWTIGELCALLPKPTVSVSRLDGKGN